MKYKLGDKIKIIDFPSSDMNGLIGVVVNESKGLWDCRIRVTAEGKHKNWDCWMSKHEIEPLIKIGEQLLFPFMEKL